MDVTCGFSVTEGGSSTRGIATGLFDAAAAGGGVGFAIEMMAGSNGAPGTCRNEHQHCLIVVVEVHWIP